MKTLHHIWQTQEYWWSYISENNEFDFAATAALSGREEIFSAIRNNSQKLADYVDSLTEEDLIKNVKLNLSGFSVIFKIQYIQHVIIHGTYHRGQIVTMGRCIGITDAPMTDYNFWNIYKDK